jgi:hypothetical protein
VASVVPDSAADRVGIRPGDLITELAGLAVGENLTLTTYCDILDSHHPDLPFRVRVWRAGENSYLEGVVNSAQTLRVTGPSIEGQIDQEDSDLDGLPPGDPYSEFELIWDDDFLVSFEIPTAWRDQESGDWTPFEEVDGAYVAASGNLDRWYDHWDEPGVMVGVSSALPAEGVNPEFFLSNLELEDCVFGEQFDYDDGLYEGAYSLWFGCGGDNSVFVDWAALDRSGEFLLSAQFIATSEADLEAMYRVLETLFLTIDLE